VGPRAVSALAAATSGDRPLEVYGPRDISTTLVEPGRRAVQKPGERLRPLIDATGTEVISRTVMEVLGMSTNLFFQAPVSRWQPYVEARLNALYESGEERDLSVVGRAGAVAQSLFATTTPTPSVGLADDGGIAYSWHRNGWHLEIEITSTDTTYWALRRGASIDTVLHGSVSVARQEVQELLTQIGDA
jgi:hypothetical protein